jgi:CRP-like cAMP-binding protein
MLHSCDVLDLECHDYDNRNALHIAAAEGRLLAVSYLLSNSFSPHFKDRWGSTALDDALNGSTMYHMYCAKLIQSMGGGVSTLKGTDEGRRALERLEQLPIEEVRKRLMYLNRLGYNQIVPKQVVEERVAEALERCLAHLPLMQTMIEGMKDSAESCRSATASLHELAVILDAQVRPICRLLDSHPCLRQRKYAFLPAPGPESVQNPRGMSLEGELSILEKCEVGVSRFDEYTGSRHFLIKRLSSTIRAALADGYIDANEQQQIDLAWEELISAGEKQLLAGLDVLDSDEEAELYEDVDKYMSEREFCEAHGIERNLYKLYQFQNSTLRINDMEAMCAKLFSIFELCRTAAGIKSHEVAAGNDPYVGITELVSFFDLIGDVTMHHTPRFEIEAMIYEAQRFQPKVAGLFSDSYESSVSGPDGSSRDVDRRVSLKLLVAGSQSFRAAMLGLEVEEAFGLVMQKSNLCSIINESLLREICKSGVVRLAGKGELLFNSDHSSDTNVWFVVISGSLTLSRTEVSGNEDLDWRSLGNGNIFGGAAYLRSKIYPCTIRCTSACTIVELPLQRLDSLRERFPSNAEMLAKEMAESSFQGGMDGAAVETTSESVELALYGPDVISKQALSYHTKDEHENLVSQGTSTCGESTKPTILRNSPSIADTFIVSTDQKSSETFGAGYKPAITMLDLCVIKSGFKCITEVWRTLSAGDDFISARVLRSLQDEVGEVGTGVFGKLFLPEQAADSFRQAQELNMFHDVDAGEFWGRWIRLLLDNLSDEERHFRVESWQDVSKEGSGCSADEVVLARGGFIRTVLLSFKLIHKARIENSCFRLIIWISGLARSSFCLRIFNPDRSLRRRYLDRRFIELGRYEEAYIYTVGSLNNPLEEVDIPAFIQNLFPDLANKITSTHCFEFKDIFAGNAQSTAKVTWADISKVVLPILSLEGQVLFIGSRFHPHSRYMAWFRNFQKLLAVYHFVSIPLLLCFVEDSASMSEPQILYTFIPADVLTFLSLLIEMNTACKGEHHNEWRTHGWEIFKGLGNRVIIPVLPLDWIAFALDNSYETCLWIRMTKLLVFSRMFPLRQGLESSQLSVIRRVANRISALFAILHLCSCFYYYMARKYPLLDPANPFVWYKVNHPEDDPGYRPNLSTDAIGFEYEGLSCNETQSAACLPGETWYYFGMGYADGLMSKYSLSFYVTWVKHGLKPENFLEVLFCIFNIIVHLTVVRCWLMGDLSRMVIQSIGRKFAGNKRAMKITSFISKNNFSPELASEIRSYCENAVDQVPTTRYSKVLRFLPRFLQDEVARHVCRDLLDGMEMLAGCSSHFKDLLSSAITTKAFSPEEYLFRVGEVASELYIVQTGAVDSLVEAANTLTGEKVEATFNPGTAVEQVAFFFQLKYVVSARAFRQGAVCLRVGRDSFLQILKCFPIDEELVSQNALKSISFTKSGTSTVSFLSDKEGEKTVATTKSHLSDVSAGRHGKRNRQSILQIEANRKKMKTFVMFSAVKVGDLPTLEWCMRGNLVSVNDRDDSGRSLLHIAACEGHKEITLFLLKASADVNCKDQRGNTPLNEAVQWLQDDIAVLIREKVPGTSLSFDGFQAGSKLCEAASEGNLAQVSAKSSPILSQPHLLF